MDNVYAILKEALAWIRFILDFLNPFSTIENDVVVKDDELTDDEAEKFSGE